METKEELVENIREWIKIDNEIRALQKEINTRKDEKKKISAALMQTMKSNEIDCFDINNGQIRYVNKKVKKPMTKKVLFDVLTKYYNGDFLKANEMKEFIMDNREETNKECISRKISSKFSTTSNTNSIE